MKIRSVELQGFRQYMRHNQVPFANHGDKKLTLFHGENGGGKTAFLNAIYWCLTGEFTEGLENPEKVSWYNVESGRDSVEETYVSVSFEHGGREYVAHRRIDKGQTKFSLNVMDSGSEIPLSATKAESQMEAMLPKGLAPYFLFDGEGFTKGVSGGAEGHFGNSVKRILGYNFALRTLSRLDEMKNDLVKQIRELEAQAAAGDKSKREIEDAHKNVDRIHQRVQDLASKVSTNEESLKVISEKIGAANVETAKKLENDRKEARERLKQADNQLKLSERARRVLIRDYARSVFSIGVFDSTLELINERRRKGTVPAPYRDVLIDDLLKAGVCLCERHIGESEEKALRERLKEASTESVEHRVQKAQALPSVESSKIPIFLDELSNAWAGIDDAKSNIEHEKQVIDDLDERLKKIDSEAINKLIDDRESIEFALGQQRSALRTHEGDLASAKLKLDKLKPKSIPAGLQARIDKLQSKIGKIDRLNKTGQAYLDRVLAESLEYIRLTVNGYLQRTRISLKASVSDDFSFKFVDGASQIASPSKGERKFLDVAFVCSLIKLATIRSNVDDGILVPGTVAPMIIDAPFSNLDETNVSIVSQMLLEVSEQLVLFLSSSNWADSKHVLESHVGRQYYILKHVPGARAGRPTDPLVVDGKTYECTVYGDDEYPESEVMEIN